MNEHEQNRELAHLETLTTLQSREDIENGKVIYQRQNIVVSPFLYESTKQMTTHTQNETYGFILSEEQITDDRKFFLAQYMQILGTGDGISVYADPKKARAAVELINRYPGLKFIDFHCHPDHLGPAWSQRFSSGDYSTILKKRERNPNYTHVLFTPTHILTNGREKTSFVLAEMDPGLEQATYGKKYQKFDAEYREILDRIQ